MLRNRAATAILKLKLPTKRKNPSAHGYPVKGQKRLNALWKHSAKPGELINPYGKRGNRVINLPKDKNLDHLAKRPEAMKRARLRLKDEKKHALEMHELQQLARENAVAAMQTLIEISRNPRAPEPSRIAASAVILDRGYGKASQVTMSASLNNGKTNEITGDELDRRIGQALKRVEDLTRGTPKAPAGKDKPANIRKLN